VSQTKYEQPLSAGLRQAKYLYDDIQPEDFERLLTFQSE
jgi:hypothetical protein